LKANEQVGRIIGAFTDKLILETETIEQLLAASKGIKWQMKPEPEPEPENELQ